MHAVDVRPDPVATAALIVVDAAGATWARRAFAASLDADIDGEERADIVLAVYEALADAAERA